MPQTLHGTSSLVRLPDRTLTRLENGVAEVTRRYACRTSVAATFRSQFDVGATLPGEVGFIIKYKFSERKREDGFTEFEVTGVGPDPTTTDSGGLKAQDDRTVATFPSGLVRVDRTYVCPTANEAAFRPILLKGNQPPFDDLTPAIDGLYIFPDPNEVRRDDGFTEFSVSSYGRINTTGAQRPEFLRDSTYGLNFSYSQIVVENCLPTSTALKDFLEAPPIDLGFEIDPIESIPALRGGVNPAFATLQKTVRIAKSALVKFLEFFGGGTVIAGPSYFLPYGGLILEFNDPSFGIYQTLYVYSDLNARIISNSTRNFGFFTEFVTTYGFGGNGSPIAIGPVFGGKFSVNGVPV